MNKNVTIMDLNDLKNKLSPKWLSDGNNTEEKFKELAEFLINGVSIQKGDKEYWMTDIEFYLYTSHHKDIITYPRNCEAGQWFFHSSGVDISFESNVETKIIPKSNRAKAVLTDNAAFGGILIRGIKSANNDVCINGPMLVCDELFDQFDAFGNVTNFPKLILKDHSLSSEITPLLSSAPRVNLITKKKNSEQKVDSILSNNYCGNEIETAELYDSFGSFLGSEYRFYLSHD